jgi:hypothetical protein
MPAGAQRRRVKRIDGIGVRRRANEIPRFIRFFSVLALTVPAVLNVDRARAEQPPPPCHPNPTAAADEDAVRGRGDIVNLPGELQDRLAQLANRPHTYLPLQVFNEADSASQLFSILLVGRERFRGPSPRP